jgi:hypothetical protein
MAPRPEEPLRALFAFISALVVAATVGCAHNDYERFYVDNLGGQPVASVPTLAPTDEPPKIYRGGDADQDNLKMSQNGFVQIGYSSFNGADSTPAHNQKLAIGLAQKKQAAVVLLYSKFDQTVTEEVPYQVQTGSTTTTWTHPGRDGLDKVSSETTANYETQTQTVQTNLYDYTATFWVKKKLLLDEPQNQSLATKNGLATLYYPPSFNATNDQNGVAASRKLGGALVEEVGITAVPTPISSDRKEFARVVEAAEEHGVRWRGFTLGTRSDGTCDGAPGIISTGTFSLDGGPDLYASWACDFIKDGKGYRFAYVVPKTLAAQHEPMLRRMIEGVRTTSSGGDEPLDQTYTSADGHVTVHYPASFAASPQADGELIVQRNVGGITEALGFRTEAAPAGVDWKELSRQREAEKRKKALASGLSMDVAREEEGTCNGSPALMFTGGASTARNVKLAYWHCSFVRNSVAYHFGYAVSQSAAAEHAPMLKKIVEAAKTAP